MPPHLEYYQRPGYVISCGIILSVLAIATVSARFWARIKYRQGLKADDWCILPALALTVGQAINMIYGVAKKSLAMPTVLSPELEAHPTSAKTHQIVLMAKIQFAYILMLPLTLGFIKLSLLSFYRRIFAVSSRSYVTILIHFMMTIVILWTIAFFFASLFACGINFWAAWGSDDDIASHCSHTFEAVYALCVSDFITDALIIFIPIPLIWKLKLSTRKKIATTAVFLVGLAAIAASLTRLVETVRLTKEGFNSDEILSVTTYLYWGMVESGVGVIVACLPSLKCFARAFEFNSAWNSIISIWSNRSASSFRGRAGSNDSKSTVPKENGHDQDLDVEMAARPGSATKSSIVSERPLREQMRML